MRIARAKKVAAEFNYDMWYNRSLQLWTLIPLEDAGYDGRQTLYISPAPLAEITEENFRSSYMEDVPPVDKIDD